MTYETNQIIKHQLWLEYNDNYLAHYGTKGQKWGIRKYQNPDGSLTEEGKIRYNADNGGNKKFDRKFNKDVKRLQKLDDKANVKLQQQRAEKYAARAKTAGKVALGSGLSALGLLLGSNTFDNVLRTQASEARINADLLDGLAKYSGDGGRKFIKENHGLSLTWESKLAKWRVEDINRFRKNVGDAAGYAFLGTGATALGSGAVAGASLAKALAAKKRTTAEGHAKAIAKRNEEYNRMQKTYGNTSYSDRLKQRNKQIISNRGNRK